MDRNQEYQKQRKARETFKKKRSAVTYALWSPDGGGPNADDLWLAGGEASPANQVGKSLWRQLKPVVKAAGHDDKLLDRFTIPVGYEVATDLKAILEQALAAAAT